MRKMILKQVGITKDGEMVVSGTLKFHQTTGVPLETILEVFYEEGIVPVERFERLNEPE